MAQASMHDGRPDGPRTAAISGGDHMTGGFSTRQTTVVLHPKHQDGVKEAFQKLPGISLVCPVTEDAIPGALAHECVLVTSVWRDAYLQPGLRWLQSHSTGYDQFPIETFRSRGIIFSNASGVHIVTAEHAIALLLCLIRDIHLSVNDMAARRWNPHQAPEVGGRTIVIAGLGAIGEGIAKRLAAWDVRLIGVTRSPGRYAGVLQDVRPLTELANACAEASVLMVALPAAPETHHVVSAAALDALRDGWLINVGRGSVVEESALVDRLRNGHLRGAGLDVFEAAPLTTTSALWHLSNVVITPFMAGLTSRCGERLAELLAHNVLAYQGGGTWRNRIC